MTINNKDFAWKVFCEAPNEFLIGEMGYEWSEIENLLGENLYKAILKDSENFTDEEKIKFMTWHCQSMNIEPFPQYL